jgi:hypothetical protein
VFSAGEVPDGVACFGADAVGTFLGYGADVRVGLSDSALSGDAVADPELPLPVLIGGWARGLSAGVSARAWVVDGRAPVEHCVAVGAMLRRELDGEPGPRGVLLVADGANTLSLAAPGYLDPRAQGVQERIDTALEAGDCAALAGLDTDLCAQVGVSGRSAYQVLAGLFDAGATGGALGAPVPGTREPDRAEISEGLRVELPGGRGVVASELARVETLYRAAPFGVGYYGGVWRPEQAT